MKLNIIRKQIANAFSLFMREYNEWIREVYNLGEDYVLPIEEFIVHRDDTFICFHMFVRGASTPSNARVLESDVDLFLKRHHEYWPKMKSIVVETFGVVTPLLLFSQYISVSAKPIPNLFSNKKYIRRMAKLGVYNEA